jgi:hypothetical protein
MAIRVQVVEEKVGLIAQAEAEYEKLMEEMSGYCQKARDLRQQADELRCSGSTDPQVATEVRKLLEQAEYYDQLADQKDGHPRLEVLRRIEGLQREASALKGTIQRSGSPKKRKRMQANRWYC